MSNQFARLPLQRKVSATLLLTIAVFAAISYTILTAVITPAFENLELSAAGSDLVRAEQSIRADIENLEAMTADWADWDDIYEYVSGGNPSFLRSNLNRSTLEHLGIDMLAVYAGDSKEMWGMMLVDEEEQPLRELNVLNAGNRGFNLLTAHKDAAHKTAGIVSTGRGLMMISSRPILRSDSSGPVAGALVMAQFLDAARLERLRERTAVMMSWSLFEDFAGLPGHDVTTLAENSVNTEVKKANVESYRLLKDVFGEPIMVLGVETPRRITALGRQTVTAAMLFLLSAGLLAAIVMWFLLRGTILRPIESLAEHMKKMRQSGDLSHRITRTGDDEIGALAQQFNNLTAEVHEARKALLFQSFKAGKADTAAEVLHNIRNAMTPMINGIERLTKAFRVADELRVTEATEQIRNPDTEPDRTKLLADYVDASFDRVKSVCSDATDDIRVIMSQAKQIEGILATQEKFANVSPVQEDIVVDEVVVEATHVVPKDKEPVVNVVLDAALERYRVRAHRISLLQVLGNLILNAYESIERSAPPEAQIRLTATDTILDEQPMVRLTVCDNGSGFDEAISKQIFQRGYTSKSSGDASGLGLHWCANAVASMGGRIIAESNGAGQGAEFHVLLPAAQGV